MANRAPIPEQYTFNVQYFICFPYNVRSYELYSVVVCVHTQLLVLVRKSKALESILTLSTTQEAFTLQYLTKPTIFPQT